MTSLLRSPGLALPILSLALGAAACTSDPADDTEVTANDLSTIAIPAFDGQEKTITIEIGGSGMMPAGSTCVPHRAIYHWEAASTRFSVSRCVAGADGLFHDEFATGYASEDPPPYVVATKIEPAKIDAYFAALRQVVVSQKLTCEIGAKASIKLSAWRDDGSSSTFYDDFYGCEAIASGESRVRHVEPLLEQLDTIASGLRFTSTVPSAPVATEAGMPIWEEEADFSITKEGSGEVPLGSECAPGSETFSFVAKYKQLVWADCLATTPSDPRLRKVRHYGTLDDAELDALRAAMQAAVTTTTPTCEPKPFLRVVRSRAGSPPTSFVDEASACHSYSLATTNMDGIFTVLHSLTR